MIPLVCRFLSIFLMFRSIPNLCKQSSCLQTFLLHTFSTQIASLIIWICHFKVYTLCNSLPCFGTYLWFCAYFLFIRLQTEYTDLILHDTHCLHLLLFSRVQSTYIEDFHMDAAHNCWFNELNLNRSLFLANIVSVLQFLINSSHHHHLCSYHWCHLEITGETFFPGNLHKNNESVIMVCWKS